MDDLSILYGEPLKIGELTIKHPKIKEILSVGEEFYLSAINIFVLRPSDLMVQLYDIGMDYTKVTPYELFILICGDTVIIKNDKTTIFNENSEVSKKIGWLTGIYDFCISSDENGICLYSNSSNIKIDKGVYTLIRKYLMQINFREEKDKYNPANDTTKKFLIEQERKKQKRDAKHHRKSAMSSEISSLVWASNKTFDDIGNLFVYQFYDGLSRINKIKNYDNLCLSFYTGNMKSSDFKRLNSEENWMD